MNVITISLGQGGCIDAPLLLGYAGENDVEAVDFDFSAWAEAYGEGSLALELMRASDTAPYPAVLTIDGTVARWTVSDVDTARSGPGVAQLVYKVDGKVKKSMVFKFFVGSSIRESGDEDPWGPILDRMEEILAEVQRQAAAADQSAEAAGGSAQNAEAWAVGERGGEPVPAEDPTHANNAKYYAEQAGETAREFAEETAPAAVRAVNEAGAAKVQQINEAGTAALEVIGTARTGALDAIGTEKTGALNAIDTAGQTAGSAVDTAKTDAVQAVNTTKTDALTAVGNAQTAAVGAVRQEGTTQQAAVQKKGEDALATIPEDYTELSGDVNDLKSAISDGVIEYSPISVNVSNSTIAADGTVSTLNGFGITQPIPVIYGHVYRIELEISTTFNFRVIGTTTGDTAYNSSSFRKLLLEVLNIQANTTRTADVIINDKNVHYIYISKRNSCTIRSLKHIGKFDDYGLGLNSMPNTMGALNCIKRARQFTDIEWTPIANLPRTSSLVNEDERISYIDDRFDANKTYKGLPYSHGNTTEMAKFGYSYGHIGYDVPLSAFVSSLYNSNSFLYKESTRSAYYSPTAYGATCDVLMSYALSLADWTGSNNGVQSMINAKFLNEVISVGDLTTGEIKIEPAQVLVNVGVHVALITDVIRDEDNNIIYIEVSEATFYGLTNDNILGGKFGGKCVRWLYDFNDFKNHFAGYTIYYYNRNYFNTYTPNEYVSVGKEAEKVSLYTNMPIIPYMGEGFVYKEGHIDDNTLLTQTSRYAYIAVYKDDAVFGIYEYSAILSVPFTAVGEYKAFLFNSSNGTIANMTEHSLTCHWTVI